MSVPRTDDVSFPCSKARTMIRRVDLQILGLVQRCRHFDPVSILRVFAVLCVVLTPIRIQDSPVFDPVTGFGGDGVPNTYQLPENFLEPPSRVPINPYSWRGCVQDGAFAKYPISLGPGKLVTQHCLVRSINNTYSQYLTSHAVRNATRQPTFELFRIELEGRPITPTPKMHDSAHVLVGGDMGNFYSSVAGECDLPSCSFQVLQTQ